MIILNELFCCSQEEFENTKSANMINMKCLYCNTIYQKSKKKIINNYNMRNRLPKFCSNTCSGKYKTETKTQLINCTNCNIKFIKGNSIIRNNNFCSSSCAATFNNKNKTHGIRRSKLEAYLENKLKELYPNLDFIFNGKETINSELDIYIPSLKLAFELNGIFHYEPIFGDNKLNQIQNNDSNKFQKCQEKEISLCIIDTSSQKRFTEQSSQKFLDIIIKIIASHTGFEPVINASYASSLPLDGILIF